MKLCNAKATKLKHQLLFLFIAPTGFALAKKRISLINR